ncbi:MAG: TolC family outer membrane protein [Rhizobiaceae bacterium]
MSSAVAVWIANSAHAESINSALAAAYNHNSTLNAQRAATRAADELLPQAKSGYRPTIYGDANFGFARTTSNVTGNSSLNPYGFGVTIDQSIFDGFRTLNNVGIAESSIRGSRETLRRVEQVVLQNGASAYADVLASIEIVAIRQKNLAFLAEQLRSSQARLEVGEGTRTDVAQSEARYSEAQATLEVAKAELAANRARYLQVIGRSPNSLSWPRGPVALYPRSLNEAQRIGLNEHPAVLLTRYGVDAAAYVVKLQEGGYLPNLTLRGNANQRYNNGTTGSSNSSASATLNLAVPLYQGGRVSSQVREAKQLLSQARIQVDEARDQVRADITSAWHALESARLNVIANQASLRAARLALEGVIEERNVGQRTQLDVLNSQSDVLFAEENLVNNRRIQVIAGYALVASMGRLNSQRLGLAVRHYYPRDHYEAVKDLWIGLRTPSGR